jgi:hypothetical protein
VWLFHQSIQSISLLVFILFCCVSSICSWSCCFLNFRSGDLK